jgi:hypothetical protein
VRRFNQLQYFTQGSNTFNDNLTPHVHRVHNNVCIGVRLVLDADEPPDNGSGSIARPAATASCRM